ncbi:MAG: FAD-dependent oxidoreductase, partial [Coriobacteriales bacterium]|nr:FAD-dependent oxidoreductase [Coriobacteriales bacterium]
MSSISRRDLLKNAAAGSAAVAALGMAGVASADEAAPAAGQHSWEVKPEPITEVSETVDCDVLIIGGGYSGCSCACNAAQNGLNTVLVEKDDVLNGHGVGGTGAVKSRVMDENGVVLDKPIEMERWVATCGNRCNEKIVG